MIWTNLPGAEIEMSEVGGLIEFNWTLKIAWFVNCVPVISISFVLHFVMGALLVPFSAWHLILLCKNETQDEHYWIKSIISEVRSNEKQNLYCLEENWQLNKLYCFENSCRVQNDMVQVLAIVNSDDELIKLKGEFYVKVNKGKAVSILKHYSPYANALRRKENA